MPQDVVDYVNHILWCHMVAPGAITVNHILILKLALYKYHIIIIISIIII